MMDIRAIVTREAKRLAMAKGAYHAPLFVESCQRVCWSTPAIAGAADEAEIIDAVGALSDQYDRSVVDERERIHAIDALAAQMPRGHEALVRRAQFETPITADELAEQVLAAERETLHRIPARPQ